MNAIFAPDALLCSRKARKPGSPKTIDTASAIVDTQSEYVTFPSVGLIVEVVRFNLPTGGASESTMKLEFTSAAADPRILEILEHYGFPHQTLKLAEEASELAAAAARYHDRTSDPGDDMPWLRPLAEECADVLVLISQLCTDMPFEDLVRETFAEKLDRQIARIRAEKETYREAQKAPSAARSVAAEGISDASARIYEGATR